MRAAKKSQQFAASIYCVEFLFVPQVEIVRDSFSSDILPAIESRPEKIQRASVYFRNTVPEPIADSNMRDEIGDRQKIAKVFLDRNRQATINLMFVHLFHLFQQQLVELMRITCKTDEQRDQEFRAILQAVFEATGVDVTFLSTWSSLEELWWMANIIKHVDANHGEKLRLRRRELFRDSDSFVQSILDRDNVTRPVRMALAGVDFFPDVPEYIAKSNGILEFWKEFALILHEVQPKPKTLRDWIVGRRVELLALCEKHGARNVRLFGSVARNEAGPGSDIDLLVNFDEGRSLLDQVGLQQALEDLLERKVDVVSERGLKAPLRDRVLREAIPL